MGTHPIFESDFDCLTVQTMSVSMFASSAFGSIGNELKGNHKETVKSTFSGDTIISAMIAAAPSGMLMIMLFFTPQLYGENGIACSSRMHSQLDMNTTGQCGSMCRIGEDYRLADYYYIKSFCFGSMTDWRIDNKTGEIDEESSFNLARYKLYPYVLFACSCLGSCATMLWTISAGKISAHLEYVIDGVEEAVGELMQGIQMTKKFKEATGPSSNTQGTQTETEKENGTGDAKEAKTPATKTNSNGSGRFATQAPTKISIGNTYHKIDVKLSDLEPEGPLIDEIKEIWKNDESYEKFAELNKVLMEDHGTKDDLVRTVIFNRIATLLICLMSALLIFYLYVIDLRSIDGRDLSYQWNCRLPPVYHYVDRSGHTWQTTYCIYTSRASREVLTIILFALYIIIGIGEICWCIHNVRAWKKCFRLVEYLPFLSDFDQKRSHKNSHYKLTYGVSDLHLLMALVQVNEGSRDKINVPMKVLKCLPERKNAMEPDRFLSVFLEVLIWSATDEGVDELVKNMVKPEEKPKN